MPTLFQINVTANWGSTGRIAEDIGQLAMAKGWESHIAYGRYVNESKSLLYHIGTKKSIYGHWFQTRLFDRHGLASKQATQQLIAYIERIKPDIIHLHNIHGYFLNYPILFNYLSQIDIPVVWTLHDCWTFTGHCAHYTYAKCKRWKTECYNCPQKKSYPASFLFDHSKKNFIDKKHWFTSLRNLTLVPVSKWLEGELRLSFLKDFPIETIHNGVDLKVFKPSSMQKEVFGLSDKFVILGVASVWNFRKGLADFVRLRKLLPDSYTVILIGLNKKQIKRLPSGVIGISRTNNVQELVDYYSLADVFVNLTWEDTFPTTNLEALACGTPIITYQTGGSVEAVNHDTGHIVEQGNMEGLVATLSEIRTKGKGYYTEACRKSAVTQFGKLAAYEKYLSLYQRLINMKLCVSFGSAAYMPNTSLRKSSTGAKFGLMALPSYMLSLSLPSTFNGEDLCK